MNDSQEKTAVLDQAGGDLFNFAIEREDVKWLMQQLSQSSRVTLATFEYELQILKIISVGWGISYLLAGTPKRKAALGELYWGAVNDFSKQLSETTGLMTGQDIDYFEILKIRLDQYVQAMEDSPQATEPATVIGPAFAGLCGHADDLFAAMAGSKMFANAVARVRQYLETLKLR